MHPIGVLEIDDHINDKIEARHGVTFAEVYEAVTAPARHVRRGRDGLYKIFSQTEAGRYILVVLAHRGGDRWTVVTARDMTQTERRMYQRVTGD